MNEQALDMTEVKEKLRNLKEHMPNPSHELVWELGRVLADYILNPKLVPAGFVMGCHFCIHDLEKGVNGFTGKPIRSSLVGYPPMTYALMSNEIVPLAEATCPTDFAAAVKAFVEQVEQEMQKERERPTR